jgi:hypothetical protein
VAALIHEKPANKAQHSPPGQPLLGFAYVMGCYRRATFHMRFEPIDVCFNSTDKFKGKTRGLERVFNLIFVKRFVDKSYEQA